MTDRARDAAASHQIWVEQIIEAEATRAEEQSSSHRSIFLIISAATATGTDSRMVRLTTTLDSDVSNLLASVCHALELQIGSTT